jgi:hypothetical protein
MNSKLVQKPGRIRKKGRNKQILKFVVYLSFAMKARLLTAVSLKKIEKMKQRQTIF